VVGRPSNFSWLIADSVAGSGYPGGRRALRWLKARGIDTILSLTDESIDIKYAEGIGIKVRRLPMVNMEAANPEALDHAVDLMAESGNGKVLVHCLAGMGRTGMVFSAYLIREKGMSAGEALSEVKRLRPGSLKRRVQNKAVHDYEAYLFKVRGRKPSS
jgi:atypical dual specificity phosphatase